MMGADLYIRPIFERQRNRYAPKFYHWVTIREASVSQNERAQAQEQVARYFDLMYAKGYFRDSYNDSNLLCRFELSWWEDVVPRLNAQHALDVTQTTWLLRTLKEHEPVFKASTAKDPQRDYFVQTYRELRAFLRLALQRNEPIECSM